jgi:hypothetical protein
MIKHRYLQKKSMTSEQILLLKAGKAAAQAGQCRYASTVNCPQKQKPSPTDAG